MEFGKLVVRVYSVTATIEANVMSTELQRFIQLEVSWVHSASIDDISYMPKSTINSFSHQHANNSPLYPANMQRKFAKCTEITKLACNCVSVLSQWEHTCGTDNRKRPVSCLSSLFFVCVGFWFYRSVLYNSGHWFLMTSLENSTHTTDRVRQQQNT